MKVKVGRVLLRVGKKGSVSTVAHTGQCLFEEIKGSREPQKKWNILLNVASLGILRKLPNHLFNSSEKLLI